MDIIISDLNREEIVETFYENESKRQIKKVLELKKVKISREKIINYMLNGKDTIIPLIAG